MEEVRLQAGESHRVLKRRHSSVPMTYRFNASAVGGGAPQGRVEVRDVSWLFKRRPRFQPLARSNAARVGFSESFVDIWVHADSELRVQGISRDARSLRPVFIMALLIVVVAVVIAGLTLLR